MSETQSSDRTSDLGDLFVAVTGDDTVTEQRDPDDNNRAAPNEEYVDREDGLDDAVEGGEARPSAG